MIFLRINLNICFKILWQVMVMFSGNSLKNSHVCFEYVFSHNILAQENKKNFSI